MSCQGNEAVGGARGIRRLVHSTCAELSAVSVPCPALPCCTAPRYALPYLAVPCLAVPCRASPRPAAPCCSPQATGGEWRRELLFTVPRGHPEIERLEGRYKK